MGGGGLAGRTTAHFARAPAGSWRLPAWLRKWLTLVVAEIIDWLADMLVMGGYALEVIWLLCRIVVMFVLVLGKRFAVRIRRTFW